MRPSSLPVLLQVNNVWDSRLITCDPLLKRAGWQQEVGSGQHGGESGQQAPFSWLFELWQNHTSLYVTVCPHFSFWSHSWSNLVCSRWCVYFCVGLWHGAAWNILIVTFLLSDSCFCVVFFACSDASVPTPDALLILEVRVILTWSSFNWQIERISLTTSLSSHSTLLYLTQWVELSCHLRGKPANSVSFSHSQVQMHLRKLFLSSSLGLPPSLVLFQVRKVLFSGPQTPT